MAGINITNIDSTPFFPKVEQGEPLKQVARLSVNNTQEPAACKVCITVEGKKPYIEDIGVVAKEVSVHDIHVLDIQQPSKVSFELLVDGNIEAQKSLTWQPQKKWTIHCVQYSHHDMGFQGYPHQIRTWNRHGNFEAALEFCKKTEDWDQDSKFRYVVETSEPITSYIGFFGKDKAQELARYIRQGRIQIGGVHNTVNSEQLSHECIARLFYLSNRHSTRVVEKTQP